MARKSLGFDGPARRDESDPPEMKIMRVRQLAAHALGTIGRIEALPALRERMNNDDDPRVQLAAAMAIVQLTNGIAPGDVPFHRRVAATGG